MTYNASVVLVSYAGNGSTTSFPTGFKFFDLDHVRVVLRNSSGVETVWTRGTQFTIDPLDVGKEAGGTVVVSTTPTDYTPQSGETLVVSLVVPYEQQSDLPLGGPLPSATIEQMSDLSAMMAARLDAVLDRTFRVMESDTQMGSDLLLPVDSDRASKAFQFDSSGKPLMVSPSDASGTSVTANGSTMARALAERFADVINAKDWGAVGDGVTDDAPAVQDAVDRANTLGGGTVFIPASSNVYLFGSSVTVHEQVVVIGAGRQTECKANGDFPVFKIEKDSGSSVVNGAEIHSMTIRGGGNTNTSAHGIQITQPNHCMVSNCSFFSCRNALDFNTNAHQMKIDQLRIEGAGADQNHIGVYVHGANANFAIVAYGINVKDVVSHGYRLEQTRGSRWTSCQTGDCGGKGWYIGDPATSGYSVQFAHFVNCLADTITEEAWYFSKGSATAISEIHMSNCWAGTALVGLHLDGVIQSSFVNFMIRAIQQHAIVVQNATEPKIVIAGSSIQGYGVSGTAQYDGVHLNNVDRVQIIGNHFRSDNAGARDSVHEISGTDGTICIGNWLSEGATRTGPTSIFRSNKGYRTENSGSSSIANGTTSIAVTHNLAETPNAEDISIIGKENPTNSVGTIWIDTITSTQFTVNVESDPGASGWDFGWRVAIYRG